MANKKGCKMSLAPIHANVGGGVDIFHFFNKETKMVFLKIGVINSFLMKYLNLFLKSGEGRAIKSRYV
jgi:hypothetical protein